MNSLKNNYKEMKIQILKEAGFAQHTYWTTFLEKDEKFSCTKTTIGELGTPEGDAKWEQGELDIKTPEYKSMMNIIKESLAVFKDCEYQWKMLSSDLVTAGILKKGLSQEFYGQMCSVIDKQTAGELFDAKWKVNNR